MNLNQEQIGLAIKTGLDLLGPESEAVIPVRLNDGVFLLKQLLAGIAQGQIALGPATQPADPAPEPDVPPPNRKQRRVAKKKVARKKS